MTPSPAISLSPDGLLPPGEPCSRAGRGGANARGPSPGDAGSDGGGPMERREPSEAGEPSDRRGPTDRAATPVIPAVPAAPFDPAASVHSVPVGPNPRGRPSAPETARAGGAGAARVVWLVDLDAFYVSVERRKDPSLRGKAVVVGHASRERGVVCSASYEARAFGVRSAMPMSRALAACPHAVVVPPDFPAYEAASAEVFRRLRAFAPTLEQVSIDEAYLDVSGLEVADLDGGGLDVAGPDRAHHDAPGAGGPARSGPISGGRGGRGGRDGADAAHEPGVEPGAGTAHTPAPGREGLPIGWVDVAARVRARLLAETGLSVSIGIGSSKSVAKVAANLAKPGGVLEVARGHEAAFLAGLPVDALPGVGPKTRERLAELRIHTIGDLARVPADELGAALGSAGADLVRRARGIDDDPVEGAPRAPRSVSRETTFPTDTADERVVAATLTVLARTAAATLRAEGLFAGAVVVKWRDAEFRTFTARTRLSAPSNRDVVLLDAVDRLRRRRHDPRRKLRLVGVSLADLCADGGHQLDLFDAI